MERATPIRALAAMRLCSAWRMSGRFVSSREGNPAGTDGRKRSSMLLPRAMGPGLRPQQNAQGVFLLADRLLQNRDRGKGLFVFRLHLVEFKLRDKAALEAQQEKVIRFFAALRRPFGNFQPPVQIAEGHIGVGDRGDQGKDDAGPPFLLTEKIGTGRFRRPPQLSPTGQSPNCR